MSTEEKTTQGTRAARDTRYPLAYDGNGNPLNVPAGAVAWRVRRGGGRRGRPRHVFDAETGRQLEVPIGASVDDLIEAGCEPDRYLLYPVDAEGRVIDGVVAVTHVSAVEEDDRAAREGAGGGEAPVLVTLVIQQHQTIRHQAEMLARALEATTSGYGRVRPAAEPAPVVIEPPIAPEAGGGFKADDIMKIAQMVFMMFQQGQASQAAQQAGP
jgi:hypothetical protein